MFVVEFLGRSSGIGFQIHLYFQLFDVAMVLVYTLSFVCVMLDLTRALIADLRPATLFVTHDLRAAQHLADRVLALQPGNAGAVLSDEG